MSSLSAHPLPAVQMFAPWRSPHSIFEPGPTSGNHGFTPPAGAKALEVAKHTQSRSSARPRKGEHCSTFHPMYNPRCQARPTVSSMLVALFPCSRKRPGNVFRKMFVAIRPHIAVPAALSPLRLFAPRRGEQVRKNHGDSRRSRRPLPLRLLMGFHRHHHCHQRLRPFPARRELALRTARR